MTMNLKYAKDFLIEHHVTTAVFVLLAATLAMFGDVLISANRVISWEGTDTYSHFIYWRQFGFDELRRGNLPLWNPHLFSGMPYLGGFQSALLYPPNWIFMILPPVRAVNLSVAAHVFLIGFFMYLWTSSRGLHPAASLTAALLVMFSGANFMHVFAGHLIDICTMAWAPLLLLSADRLMQRPSLGWHLLGTLAVAMQILAGHPQYVYYTAVTVLLYTLFRLKGLERPLQALLSLGGIYVAGAGLSAVQLLTGFETATETVRSAGVTFQFASMFSYPPENLISLVAPFLFGDIKTLPYWGRAYLWAMTFYIGFTGFLLSIYGAVSGHRETKRCAGIMAIILVLLALGKHTPLFSVLYQYFPGFNVFRGASKFIFPATLFLAMLAAIGMDSLIRQGRMAADRIVCVLVLTGTVLLAAALLTTLRLNDPGQANIIRGLMHAVALSGESYLPDDFYRDPLILGRSALFAAKGVFIAAALAFGLAILIALTRYSHRFIFLVLVLAFAEIFMFAWHIKVDFDARDTRIPALEAFLKDQPGDYRILNLIRPNSALCTDARDIWGYDPGVLLRYAQFVGFTQGYNPRQISNYIDFRENHRFLKMLRLRYIILPDKDGIKIFENRDYLPRLKLIDHWEVIPDRTALLKRMGDADFDPAKTVLLETSPGIRAAGSGEPGVCRIIDESTDHLTIAAKLSRDAVLLITDAYSRGWRVTPLDGKGQKTYLILPGNYTLLAVPLKQGEHEFRLEYAPLGYRIGRWITALFVFLFLLATILCLGTHDRTPRISRSWRGK